MVIIQHNKSFLLIVIDDTGASTELKSWLVTLCINIGSGSGHEVSEWTLRQQTWSALAPLISTHHTGPDNVTRDMVTMA